MSTSNKLPTSVKKTYREEPNFDAISIEQRREATSIDRSESLTEAIVLTFANDATLIAVSRVVAVG